MPGSTVTRARGALAANNRRNYLRIDRLVVGENQGLAVERRSSSYLTRGWYEALSR